MEEERVTITNKHGKKRIHLISSLSNGGQAGIAGLLVFGGALAVAGFMAVAASFASNKNKAKAKGVHDHRPEPKPQEFLLDERCQSEDDHETIQSRRSPLQDSTTQNGDAACDPSYWTSNMSVNQISASELLSSHTLIVDEKIDLHIKSEEESPICFHHQEIVFSDDSHPESATSSSTENGVEGECLESLLNNPSFQAQEVVDKYEPQDGQKSTESESETETETATEDDMESDNVSESGEEDSSKVTGSSSLNSNEEPVWPAELIEEPEQEFKGGIIEIQAAQETAKTTISASADYCDSHVCSDGDADDSDYAGNDGAMTVTPEATLNEKAHFCLGLNDQPSVLQTWVIPMLLLALLLFLVLLNHRSQESFYVLDDASSPAK